MVLGIESSTGAVYEGVSSPYYSVWPSPILSLATLIDTPEILHAIPHTLGQSQQSWVFREDYFDPVTRIRRGRLYEPSPNFIHQWPVSANIHDHDDVRVIAAQQSLVKTLQTYNPCESILLRNDKGLGTTIALGFGSSISTWRVVQIEKIIGNDTLVALKALTSFGILPEVDLTHLPDDAIKSITQALDRVVNSALRETPISVVDQCRNALTVILSRWLISCGESSEMLAKDLGAVVNAVQHSPKTAAANVANAIRILHPRGKSNEQESKSLRIPVEEDAELAVHAVGFILREIEWVR